MSTDWLHKLMAHHNDPELAAEVDGRARAGEVDAQYAMGLLHAEGRGVPCDPVQAYAWLTLAVSNGDRDAEELRYVVMQDMTDAQVERAWHLVRTLGFAAAAKPPL